MNVSEDDLRSFMMDDVLDRAGAGRVQPSQITVVHVIRQCSWWVRLLAGVMIAYILSSIVYVLATRHLGTPFNDSLTDHQRRIKSESSKKRGMTFGISFLVSLVAVLFLWGMI